jgi:hypothetical protein
MLIAAAFVAGCSGAQAPTPLNSLPSSLPSVDVPALCDASSELNDDLTQLGTAAAASADGSGFTLADADVRIDRTVATLNGLTVTGEATTARDAAVTALTALKGQLPDPDTTTSEAAATAITNLETARSSVCG